MGEFAPTMASRHFPDEHGNWFYLKSCAVTIGCIRHSLNAFLWWRQVSGAMVVWVYWSSAWRRKARSRVPGLDRGFSEGWAVGLGSSPPPNRKQPSFFHPHPQDPIINFYDFFEITHLVMPAVLPLAPPSASKYPALTDRHIFSRCTAARFSVAAVCYLYPEVGILCCDSGEQCAVRCIVSG